MEKYKISAEMLYNLHMTTIEQILQQLDSGDPDSLLEQHIKNLPWSDQTPDYPKSLVAGNIRHFAQQLALFITLQTKEGQEALSKAML